MITIKDVAKRAGVSISTVSYALNGADCVKQATKERVLKAAKELNYVPNINAKLLKTQKTNNLGIFLPNIHTSFYTKLIQSMYLACTANNYALVVHISNSYTSKQLVAAILSSNVDGVVILNEHLEDIDIALLKTKEIPYVFLDKPIEDDRMSSILINNEMGIVQGVEYLIHSGHKDIAFLRGNDNFDGCERLEVFKKVMEKYSLPVRNDFILNGFFETNAAYNAVRGVLPHIKHKPDAIFCANDEMALGCMQALADLNISVPEEVSVMGFDDGQAADICPIPLTTILNPTQDIGKNAILELLRLIKDPDQKGKIIRIDTELIIRRSCQIRFSNTIK